jgi:Ca2+-binding RTX toxin-like protein
MPLVSLVTDAAHHLDLLSGNDRLFGGAGDDQLVGDDRTVFSPAVTFTAGTLSSAFGLTQDLLAATADLGGFIHRLHLAVDRCEPPYGHGDSSRAVLDRTFYLGNDELDGGAGNDFLVGDNLTVMTPSLGVPANRAAEFHRLVHDLNEAGDRAQWALGELDEAAHDLRDTWVSVKQGKRTYRILEHHYDRFVFGNDTLAGGDGNEVMAGDNWVFLAPRVTLTRSVRGLAADGCGWGLGNDSWPHGWDNDWNPHGHDFDWPADEWVGGNDVLDGGTGNDLLFGDSVVSMAPVMAMGPGLGWGSWFLRPLAQEILNDLIAVGPYQPCAPGWQNPHDLPGGMQSPGRGWIGGNDTLKGGAGDDILFGQGGDDALFGDAGDDWLIGGDGCDRIEKGSGKDRIRTGNDSSRELWEKVQTYMVDLAGRFYDVPGYGKGPLPKGKIAPCSEWVKDFVIDLGVKNRVHDPNAEIKILLP